MQSFKNLDVEHDDEMVFIVLTLCFDYILLPYLEERCICVHFLLYYNRKRGGFMKKEPTDTLTLRVPISMKLRLEMIANKDGRTINSYVNKVLKEHIDNANNEKK